jgi:hypothetical protein
MDPQLLASLNTIAQNQQITYTWTVGAALVYLSGLCFVWWRLSVRLDRRHDETRTALAAMQATSQAIVAQTAELLRRTSP